MILRSKHNSVRIVHADGQACVRKIFENPADWERETKLLNMFGSIIDVPKVLHSVFDILLLEYHPLPTLLDELERQEREGFSPVPWQTLKTWIHRAHEYSGMIPGDVNLRNFLWDASRENICGIDFEGYIPGSPSDALAQTAAFLLEYTPKDTNVKKQAAAQLYSGSTSAIRETLRLRRVQNITPPDASFILLAGGASSRMGSNKAFLPFLGTTLMELQLEKARMLKIDDVIISGSFGEIPGARVVPDILPNRGPLGGLHACLKAAKHKKCIVLSVDVPLFPACALRGLLDMHTEEITLAEHDGKWEPLIGVYDAHLHRRILPMIEQSGAPVRNLIRESRSRLVTSHLPNLCFGNCNTPDAYQKLLKECMHP